MTMQETEEVLWDVALESLLKEQCKAAGEPLNMAALARLADTNNIRLDDILDTLCKLTGAGVWQFEGQDGTPGEPDSDMCRLLKANHRLNELQLDRLRGRWQPID